jgi:acyl carrier protein
MKNIKIIIEILEENKKNIKKEDKLNQYNWDSMAKINLITIINEKYKKNINIQKMQSLRNIDDLDKLIENTIKKK